MVTVNKWILLGIGISLFLVLLATHFMKNPPLAQTLPVACHDGWTFVDSTSNDLYFCSVGVWHKANTSGTSVPSGLITLLIAGSCPTGWTELAGFKDRGIVGTIAADGNAGTVDGKLALDPAGTYQLVRVIACRKD